LIGGCFQVEIDEFQNYEKALGALGEAYKVLGHAKLPDDSQETKMADVKSRMMLVKKFVDAKKSVLPTVKFCFCNIAVQL